MTNSQAALTRLKEGNARFVASLNQPADNTPVYRPAEHVEGQSPFAIVLSCSDSRVPMEAVFNQGLGDLFVVRVAGNIAAPSQIGSIEFAAQKFGTRLIVVMGHSHCGAIAATLQAVANPDAKASPALTTIVNEIVPAVAPLVGTDLSGHDLMQQAIRENVLATVAQLTSCSEVLSDLAETDGLIIVGAEYSLESGEVEFY